MTPLASWLQSHWRHFKDAPGYTAVSQAARKLDQEVWDAHKIKLLYLDDPVKFRDLSTTEVERVTRGASPECDPDYPQLGTHADPTCRALSKYTFYSLIGTHTDRPLPLYTMNTAALYEATTDDPTIADLFMSRTLWSDHPERDCAGMETECGMEVYPLPAIFTGTAWVRRDRRRKGIMALVSRLHRMVAYLRFGPLPQFATIVPDRQHDKLFEGREIGSVIETRDGFSKESRVLFYAPEDIEQSAKRVLET